MFSTNVVIHATIAKYLALIGGLLFIGIAAGASGLRVLDWVDSVHGKIRCPACGKRKPVRVISAHMTDKHPPR